MIDKSMISYKEIVEFLKEKIRTGRLNAVLTANIQMLSLYWEIGNIIGIQETTKGWGAKVVDLLAKDLKSEFPDFKGLSPRNLRYMRDFALAWPELSILQQVAAITDKPPILQQPVAKLPWGHNCLILDKLKTRDERLFYAGKAVEFGWSRNVLAHQIELHLFDRIGKLPNNFSETLPAIQSDLARELFKDPYKFDFFQLSEEAKERDLENALVDHISHFLVEMGRGFAYVGRQEHLEHEGYDYYVGLLLYHLKLHCYVVLELKVGEFIPEYSGKMNFYLSLIDKKRKAVDDKPSIGIILCRNKNNVTVEYALRDINKPIGVAGYEISFTNAIPEDLKGDLPTIEDLEQELQREVKVQSSPIAEKINAFKSFVTSLGKIENRAVEPMDIKDDLFTYTLVNLKNKLNQILPEVNKMFLETWIAPMCNGNLYDKMDEHHIQGEFALESESNSIKSIGLCATFNGFKSVGANAFVSSYQLSFSFDNFKYWVGPVNPLIEIWIEKRYDEPWTDLELTELAERWVDWMINHIQKDVEKTK